MYIIYSYQGFPTGWGNQELACPGTRKPLLQGAVFVAAVQHAQTASHQLRRAGQCSGLFDRRRYSVWSVWACFFAAAVFGLIQWVRVTIYQALLPFIHSCIVRSYSRVYPSSIWPMHPPIDSMLSIVFFPSYNVPVFPCQNASSICLKHILNIYTNITDIKHIKKKHIHDI